MQNVWWTVVNAERLTILCEDYVGGLYINDLAISIKNLTTIYISSSAELVYDPFVVSVLRKKADYLSVWTTMEENFHSYPPITYLMNVHYMNFVT